MEECYQLFISGIRSEKTRQKYEYYLRKFLDETKLKNFSALINLNDETRQDLVEKYILLLKSKGLKRSSVRPFLYSIELFFDMNKKVLHKTVLSKMVQSIPDHIRGGEKPYSNDDLKKILSNAPDLRAMALIHFMASLGARPGIIVDPVLTFDKIEPMPLDCLAVHIYANSNEHYWGFLTPEATRALHSYRDERLRDGEKITQSSPVFRADYKRVGASPVKPLSEYNAFQILDRIVKKSGIERIKIGNRYDKALNTAFRKRFNTIMKTVDTVNINLAEKLMGHSVTIPLDNTYLSTEKERLFVEFKKAIPRLVIDESERLKIENEIKQKKIDELETNQKRISDLESQLDGIKKLLGRTGFI
jgi:integrase/recombinase XerD